MRGVDKPDNIGQRKEWKGKQWWQREAVVMAVGDQEQWPSKRPIT